ncbi:hypothetical protein CAPTEDRAFT_225311 [Capitella teleta]|uniref:monoamine oxidase n=1 Tax=Capitella teleta TaxID=283909 RepID=R7TGY8_CAPTE|nr:hypothetical protein CAPTEDRAFT_225311 [Capitella teleta]|eukprot:ELT90365.1 hypothetical protein CAPTEDRAFT_225311 [Capitella teleta]
MGQFGSIPIMDLHLPKPGEKDEAAEVVAPGRCNPSRAKLFLVSIISFVVASLIVLLVALTRVNATTSAAASAKEETDCLFSEICNNSSSEGAFIELGECSDWAVVGAGLSGSYAAWNLQKLYGHSASIVLYEMTNRIGGRLLSLPVLNSSVLEFGIDSFVPYLNPRVNDTLCDLGLRLEEKFLGVTLEDVLYHFRGVGLREEHLRDPSKLPYNVDPGEQGLTAYELCKKYTQEYFPPTYKSTDGENSNDTNPTAFSVQDVLGEYASPEAIELIQSGLRANDFPSECNGHQLLDVMDTAEITSPFDDLGQRRTIVGGMVQLPVSLSGAAVAKGAQIKFESKLTRVVKGNNYHLIHFETGPNQEMTVSCTKSLVLAIPPPAIRLIDFEHYQFDDDFQSSLNSFNELTVLKIHLGFAYPWWHNASTPWKLLHTNLPISHVEELITDASYHLCLTVSNYLDNLHYWHKFLISEDSSFIVNQLQRISGLTTPIPEVTSVTYRVWDSQHPLWYSWKPGVDWELLGSKMIQPLPADSIYLVGSAFAPGALQQQLDAHLWMVERMMRVI